MHLEPSCVIQICVHGLRLRSWRKLCRDSGIAELARQADCLISCLLIIQDDSVIHFDIDADLLSGKRQKELVCHDGKADCRCLFSELLQQLVVPAACHNILAGSVGVGLENNTGIIGIFAQHAKVIGNVIPKTVAVQDLLYLLQTTDSPKGTRIGRHGFCQTDLVNVSEQLRKLQKELF